MRLVITGGAGFIGSAVIRYLLKNTKYQVINLDKLTYAGNLESLAEVSDSPQYKFTQADITDYLAVERILAQYQPDAIMHLAAESHVDRSIEGQAPFIETNITGTYVLLEAARKYWERLDAQSRKRFRFHHVSTDEVYGDLENRQELFSETTPYAPSSPYSASKAAADHLARAWYRTYGLPVVISNCSNNYGPYQFPEKLIPHMILTALHGKPLPVYGNGQQVRDWLYVEDHAIALHMVLTRGVIGETYNIGGANQQRNLDVVKAICNLLEELAPSRKPTGIGHYHKLITFVKDRPGHDIRYAIDASKIERELRWRPRESFSTGLRKTVQWYLDNRRWWERVLNDNYRLERIG